jgi:negative regulator of flagellin synthesis FlgM
MIDGIGKSGPGRLDHTRAPVEGSAAITPAGGSNVRGRAAGVQSAVFGLVAGGAPIDSAKVDAIKTAIAEGRYPVDPQRIAERMVALDLPRREA